MVDEGLDRSAALARRQSMEEDRRQQVKRQEQLAQLRDYQERSEQAPRLFARPDGFYVNVPWVRWALEGQHARLENLRLPEHHVGAVIGLEERPVIRVEDVIRHLNRGNAGEKAMGAIEVYDVLTPDQANAYVRAFIKQQVSVWAHPAPGNEANVPDYLRRTDITSPFGVDIARVLPIQVLLVYGRGVRVVAIRALPVGHSPEAPAAAEQAGG